MPVNQAGIWKYWQSTFHRILFNQRYKLLASWIVSDDHVTHPKHLGYPRHNVAAESTWTFGSQHVTRHDALLNSLDSSFYFLSADLT